MRGLKPELTTVARLKGEFMKNRKAPATGLIQTGKAGTFNYNATAKHQSRSIQRAMILRWLKERGQITTLQARNELGIMHPAGRIKELKEAGNNIVTCWQWDKDTTGKEHKQGLYVLLEGKEVRHE